MTDLRRAAFPLPGAGERRQPGAAAPSRPWPEGLDGRWSGTTRRILALHGPDGSLDMNANWCLVGEDWTCPVCRRGKVAISKLGPGGSVHCWLVAHHDHFGAGWARFLLKFDRTLICSDCNNAEGALKASDPAVDREFSFSPAEITCFIDAGPNRKHEIDLATARAIWSASRDELARRKDIRRRLRDAVPESDLRWRRSFFIPGVPIETADWSEVRAANEALVGAVADALLRRAGSARNEFLDASVAAPHRAAPDAWRSAPERPRPDLTAVQRARIDGAIEADAPETWRTLPEDWRCELCGRGKHAFPRITKKGTPDFGIGWIAVDGNAPPEDGPGNACSDCARLSTYLMGFLTRHLPDLSTEERDAIKHAVGRTGVVDREAFRRLAVVRPNQVHSFTVEGVRAALDWLRGTP